MVHVLKKILLLQTSLSLKNYSPFSSSPCGSMLVNLHCKFVEYTAGNTILMFLLLVILSAVSLMFITRRLSWNRMVGKSLGIQPWSRYNFNWRSKIEDTYAHVTHTGTRTIAELHKRVRCNINSKNNDQWNLFPAAAAVAIPGPVKILQRLMTEEVHVNSTTDDRT